MSTPQNSSVDPTTSTDPIVADVTTEEDEMFTPKVLMHRSLQLATQCPESETAFSVGSILFNPRTNRILSTGYSRELPGSTHAEQCCLSKYSGNEKDLDLFSTLMPCSTRSIGNKTCAKRIIDSGIVKRVYVGLGEDNRFVEKNVGEEMLTKAGIEVVWIRGLEEEIKAVNEQWLRPKRRRDSDVYQSPKRSSR